ncbi:unnamed protein product [Calicophoron daubneyi]|uniref:Glycoprotein-N-acetylgalactosamine 3-beta-galactosyltransferase 1 n=1 Tax=Calicophoron daubneyi TaxID=300641 RepID=A0AAV2TV88_CALDB
MSSAPDQILHSVNLNLTLNESRQHLWSKMRAILRYVYQYRNDFDFFVKADDDTYILPENLRHALAGINSEEKLMLGYPFTHIVRDGHLSGGAGYVFTRAGFKALVEESLDRHPACPTYDEDKEDVKVSICAYAVGVKFRLLADRHTTYPFSWRSEPLNECLFQWRSLHHLFEQIPLHSQVKQPPDFDISQPFIRDERSLLSQLLISDHYVNPKIMYIIRFMAYHLRPVGIVYEY